MSAPLTLMAVHAHPDDEAIGTGGLLARCADEGVRTVLVTCTGGEVGEISPQSDATPATLGQVREAELREACAILGIGALHLLGYRDSGMLGSPDNDHPDSFLRAPLEGAVAALARLIRQERPQVLVTYDERGFYGHPDHIKANRVSLAAFEAAADPDFEPALGPTWRVDRLFYSAVSRSRIRRFTERLRAAGLEGPFDSDEPNESPIGSPDESIAAVIDVSAQVERKRQALMAHLSQMGPEVFFARLPPELFRQAFGAEEFQLARGKGAEPRPMPDLFLNLR